MTKQEALQKIKELETFIKEWDESVGFKDDQIFLLSKEEYERYKDKIPFIARSYWLRSPGYFGNSAAFVSSGGSVSDSGFSVSNGSSGVRPALKYGNIKSKIVPSKINDNRIFLYDIPFIIIDKEKEIAISEYIVAFRQFDKHANDYENSDIRNYLKHLCDIG